MSVLKCTNWMGAYPPDILSREILFHEFHGLLKHQKVSPMMDGPAQEINKSYIRFITAFISAYSSSTSKHFRLYKHISVLYDFQPFVLSFYWYVSCRKEMDIPWALIIEQLSPQVHSRTSDESQPLRVRGEQHAASPQIVGAPQTGVWR